MDIFVESVALGIDAIILIACMRQYYKKKNDLTMIASAPVINLDTNLKKVVKSNPEQKLPYVVLRGTVKALGKPIISTHNPNVSGVIQSLKIKEHVVKRSSTGFWADSERTIQEIQNVMPFALESKGIIVEVREPLAGEYLDMDIISDSFHPTTPTVFDHIWGFFAGIKQKGVQSTEKMLKEGTLLTGVGELVYDDKSLKLQPPATDNCPYYLTTMPIMTLLKKIDNSKHKYSMLCYIFSAVGTVLAALIIRKYFNHKKQLKMDEERKNQMDEERKNRRRLIRNVESLSDNQICVVCKSNPIEMIILPCGHVCLCEDCADDITDLCPICRRNIEMKSVAYVL
ncbi:mitochondrial E3 ubiquitin protein ligase 1-like [Sitophilus oryzae]|uniref:RING-type E3 ubiquitin transferase n=1 Tax=Sitophilus oryzae TaxID=7048 RepID=A0A6J2YMX6_SITOR|nr:mitochondrial E3 ubiquitin protein ligase 1-like [Sitophilus oryzae]